MATIKSVLIKFNVSTKLLILSVRWILFKVWLFGIQRVELKVHYKHFLLFGSNWIVFTHATIKREQTNALRSA